jgi:thioester reductase-like protein
MSDPTLEPIAIIGIGCRLPGGSNSAASYWKMMLDGVDAVKEITQDRWDHRAYYDPEQGKPGKTYSKWAGMVEGIDQFDPAFFGITDREACHMDPQQRMLLEVSWQALEDAGQQLDLASGDETGVFVGISISDYASLQTSDAGRGTVDAYSATGGSLSIAANRISYVLNLQGPSVAVDTACSSSLVAVHLACRALWNKECRRAIAAGVNCLISPHLFIAFSSMGMLAADGRCKAFDASANGFVRGEGAGAVCLKPLSAALQDGDQIYAVIRSTAVNQDGRTAGMTVPSRSSQQALVTEACRLAGISPHDIQYVEAHGTGTAVGDPIETGALGTALGTGRQPGEECLIGSVKTNIGHLESGAGIAGLIKVALCLKHGVVPPNLHFKTPNPAIDFTGMCLKVPTVATPLKRDAAHRLLACINSFGFGGTNAHAVLEAAPQPTATAALPVSAKDSETDLLLPLSSRGGDSALEAEARAFVSYLENSDASIPLNDICAAAARRRTHWDQRLAIVGRSRADLCKSLTAFLNGEAAPGLSNGQPVKNARLVFVFSGQGPQWWAMGRELLATEPVFRQTIQNCHDAMLKLGGWSLLDELQRDEASSRMNETEFAQPAIFAIQIALAALWQSWGLRPQAVVGHSVGEVAAAYVAGVLDLPAAIRVIYHRGRCMEHAPERGKMIAAALTKEEAEARIAKYQGRVSLAAVNGPKMVSIAGDADAVEEIFRELEQLQMFVRQVPVNYAFHSAHMDPVQAELAVSLQGLQPQAAQLPLYSTVTGQHAEGEIFHADYWWQNVRQTVLFAPAIEALIAAGYTHFLEISPHPVLSNSMTECLAKAQASGLVLPSLRRHQPERATLLGSLGALHVHGHAISWQSLYPHLSAAVRLPPHSWQHARYWHEPASSLRLRCFPQTNPLLKLPLAGIHPAWDSPLDKRQHHWLRDHRVGQHMVFPGAGYIEMALAASGELFKNKPFVIEELDILRGCIIPAGDEQPTMQIVTQPDDSIFVIQSTLTSDPPNWMPHVTGRMRTESEPTRPAPFDLAAIQARCTLHFDSAQFYQTAANIELNYGPLFQGIQQCWSNDDEALARVEAPPAVQQEMDHFTVHPALLDACIQSTIAIPGDGLYLPARMGRIRIYSKPGAKVWAYARKTEFIPKKITVGNLFILDDAGNLLMEITDFQCKFTEMRALPGSGAQADWLYTPQWQLKPLLAASPQVQSANHLPDNAHLAAKLSASAAEFSAHLGLNQRLAKWESQLHQLCQAYILAALKKIGWRPKLNEIITLTALQKRLKVPAKHERLLRRLLTLLEQNGPLQAVPADEKTWRAVSLPAAVNVTKLWREIVFDFPSFHPELILLNRCASALAEVLRGTADASRLISTNMLEHFQADSVLTRVYNRIVGETVATALAQLPEGRSTRILEIGAGTGGVTASVLPFIPATAVEYRCTDTTDRYFDQAQQKFSDYTCLNYQVLDLNLPLEDQDFASERFDIVILSNALSQTQDVQQSLTRTRQLLAPGGLLIVLETDRPSAWHDLVLGLEERWWQFQDTSLRAEHPLLPAADWRKLLQATGFADIEVASDPAQNIATGQIVLLARGPAANLLTPEAAPAETAEPGSWLIFADAGGLADQAAQLLRQRGETCLMVRPADTFARRSADEATLRPTVAEDYVQLLSAEHRLEGLRGIVHLWSLDAPARSEVSTAALAAAQTFVTHSPLYLVQALHGAQLHNGPQTWFVTRGSQPVGAHLTDLSVAQAPLNGLVRVFMSEQPDLHCHSLDLDPAPTARDAQTLIQELLHADAEDEIAHRGEARYVLRLAHGSLDSLVLSAQNTLKADQCFRLESAKPGSLDKLVFRAKQRQAPAPGEVEIEVCAAALNFRDVMKALGIYPAEAADAMMLGDECAGRIVRVGEGVTQFKIGDEVMALAAGSFSSYVTTVAYAVLPKPAHLTMEEAATMMVAYLTASYALSHQGRMQKGERVLIHAATGGVGQAAVRLAQAKGAEVFATAGSDEKRGFLKQIGVPHVLDSRTVAFAEEIMRITQGEGIDMVLNSLAGEAIHQSLSILRQYGRFLEIGKRDIYGNTKVGLFAFRKNLSYHAIDLGHAIDPKNSSGIMQMLKKLFLSRKLPPLPYRSFPLSEAGHAFRYITQARQIGKVVLTVENAQIKLTAEAPAGQLQLDPQATYLVAGGLGGFGLAMSQWLVAQGARHIVLTGRSGLSTDEGREGVAAMQAAGAAVTVMKSDVSDPASVTTLLEDIKANHPPLRGVFHVAMVLDDGLINQLNAERFEKVTAPKMNGAWNLHLQTQDLPLDHFVMFSSVSSLVGSPGQGNYAAANAFLDALAHQRRLQGLPALTINWGVMAGVGYVARHKKLEEHFARIGWSGLTPAETLPILGRLMQQPAICQMMVSRIDWAKWAAVTHRLTSTPRYALLTTEDALKQTASSGTNWLRDTVLAAKAEDQFPILETFLREQVAKVLRTSPAKIDPRRPLNEIGLDSLMAVELIHQIESLTGIAIPTGQLMGGAPTVNKLSEILLNILTGGKAESATVATAQEAVAAEGEFVQDADLARWEISFATGEVPLSQIQQPQHIFLTGALEFLGAYLLRDLLQQTHATLHCLLTAADGATASQQIEAHLARYDCWDESFRARLVPVLGDLAQPLLGLDPANFAELAATVDVIYHTAFHVNHILPYAQLKQVNVNGSVEILRLAAQTKLKPVNYLSSISILGAGHSSADQALQEDDPLADHTMLVMGYSQSRWVAERLFVQARAHGLPVHVYRPGLLVGDDRTGICPTDNATWLLLKTCISIGSGPDSPNNSFLTPVDFVAAAMTRLSLNLTGTGRNYHLINPTAPSFRELLELTQACGYPMQILPESDWESALLGGSLNLQQSPIAAYQMFLPRQVLTHFIQKQSADFCRNTLQDLHGTGIACAPLDQARMQLYLQSLTQSGFLPPATV